LALQSQKISTVPVTLGAVRACDTSNTVYMIIVVKQKRTRGPDERKGIQDMTSLKRQN
jgi:hypothetical protein